MPAVSSIKFTQGPNTDIAGRAVIGTVVDGAVTVTNGDNTDVASWEIELLRAPPASALVPGILGSAIGNTPTAPFTPDVPGSYRVRLRVWDGLSVLDEDIRTFAIKNFRGFVIPPYQLNPSPLDVLDKADELNFAGQVLGWAGTGGLYGTILETYRDDILLAVSTTPFTAGISEADIYLVNTSTIGGASVFNLPSAARTGQEFVVLDNQNTAGANNVTVTLPGGHTFVGGGATYVINSNGAGVKIVRTGATTWRAVAAVGAAGIAGTGTDNAITRWDGTSALQGSGITISDANSVQFASTVVGPTIDQATTAAAAGAQLTVRAQHTTFSGGLGGKLLLQAGDGAAAGGGVGGTVDVRPGNGPGGFGQLRFLNGDGNVNFVIADAIGGPLTGPVASSGIFRVQNGWSMAARNAANSADRTIVSVADPFLTFGQDGGHDVVFRAGANVYFTASGVTAMQVQSTNIIISTGVLTVGSSGTAVSGVVRLANTASINFRNAANSADVLGVTVNASNQLVLGGTNVASVLTTNIVEHQLPDNTANALLIREGVTANEYFTIDTTNAQEQITFGERTAGTASLVRMNFHIDPADATAFYVRDNSRDWIIIHTTTGYIQLGGTAGSAVRFGSTSGSGCSVLGTITDNTSNVFVIEDPANNDYLSITTTNGGEVVALGNGNTNPAIRILGILEVDSAMRMDAPLSPTALAASGTTNNYAPGGLVDANVVRLTVTPTGGHTLTGLVPPTDTNLLYYLFNISAGATETITLTNEDTNSTAANRFVLPGAASLVMTNQSGVVLWYDATANRWRVVGKL